jgi:hypothetical protein
LIDKLKGPEFATEGQRTYIRDLGGKCPENATRTEASNLINKLADKRPTVRQRMVIRFWDRLDLLTEGVDGVSAWMDKWYADDTDRLKAWELWKLETGDNGGRSPDAIDRVPVGAGKQYLARVKAGETGVVTKRRTPSQIPVTNTKRHGCLGQVIFLSISVILFIAALCVLV